jgi:hypothetical protein
VAETSCAGQRQAMRTERVEIETHHSACEAIASDTAIPTKDPMRSLASAKAVVSRPHGVMGVYAATANAWIFG